MKSAALFTFLVALCSSQAIIKRRFRQALDDQGIQDFLNGYFISLRAVEFCPLEFNCFTKAENIHQTLVFVDFDYHLMIHSDPIDVVMEFIKAYKNAVPGCESNAKEGSAYVAQIDKIVQCPNFYVKAAYNLYNYTEVVNQINHSYMKYRSEGLFWKAGIELGAIGRIIIWGDPA